MKNTPKIRFENYVDEWKQRKLGDVSERVRGNDGRMDLPTLTISAGSGWLDQRERFSDNIAGQEQKNYTLLSKGELSYNHGNSKLAKYGVVFKLRNYEEALVPRVYHSFRVNEDASSDFIEYMFATKKPDRELAKLISSGARMDGLLNINYDNFMGINIMCPSVAEQRKIACLLRKIDSTISLYQSKCEQLQTFKKMMLKKMFPQEGYSKPEFRFDGFTDYWEQHKVGELGDIITGSTPSTKHEEYYSNDGIPWVTPTDINTNVIYDTSRKLSYEGQKVGRIVPKDSILVTCIASIGKNTMLGTSGSFNQQINGVVPLKDKYNPYFLFVESLLWSAKMKKEAAAGTMQIVNKTQFSEIETMVPTLDEQEKIGIYFEQLDNLITLHQRKCDKLVEVKKYMLKNMFI